ncbi:MAG: nitrous oxide reductase accessory protein NosL [Vicinamibacterales bacterium]
MRALSIVLLAAMATVSCAQPKPADVIAGEACWRCRRPISDVRLAAEFVADTGIGSKFRSVHCLSTWIAQQAEPMHGQFYVTDYGTGEWIRADRASYVNTVVNRNTMARDFVAFAVPASAEELARVEQGQVLDWQAVLDVGRTNPLDGF